MKKCFATLSLSVLLASTLTACCCTAPLTASRPKETADATTTTAASTTTAAPTTTTTTVPTLSQRLADRVSHAPTAMVYDVTNHKVLFERSTNVTQAPLGLVKLMTALVASQHVSADHVFTVENEYKLMAPFSSTANLRPGRELTLAQLLHGLLLRNGNDAAYVLAVQVGRIIENSPNMSDAEAVAAFCDEMNRQAIALGCKNTQFSNPTGYNDNTQMTTANDMMLICVAALENPLIAEVCATQSTTFHVTSEFSVPSLINWSNNNKLLDPESPYYYEWANGLLSGGTDYDGYCTAASATKDGRTVIVLVMGLASDHYRWEEAANLLELAYK